MSRHRSPNVDLPLWYEAADGGTYCEGCIDRDEDDRVPRTESHALGRRPWAGNPPGDRYWQCDECGGQWGPDS